jgi:hypothetical protein
MHRNNNIALYISLKLWDLRPVYIAVKVIDCIVVRRHRRTKNTPF